MPSLKRFLLIVFYSVNAVSALSQNKQQPSLKSLMAPLDSVRNSMPVEKLYLQTDRPGYAAGDTIWFKAYLLNADLRLPATKSGLLYVEMDDSDNKMVKRIMLPIVQGVSWGSITLAPSVFGNGTYTLRAYTNWMRNFGEEQIFKRSFYISAENNTPRLVKADFGQHGKKGSDTIVARLQFTGLNRQPIRLQDMQLKLMDGKHNLLTKQLSTSIDGQLAFNFVLPDKLTSKNLVLRAQDLQKGKAISGETSITLILNRPENTDLQFMPEGGHLVAGLPSQVGFKAVSENGAACALEGKIVNSKQEVQATFKTTHAGMGSFRLMPQPGEVYTAVVNLPNGSTKTYPLPTVEVAGSVLSISDRGPDSLMITLFATQGFVGQGDHYYLLGQARGVPCYGAGITFANPVVKTFVPKSLFPSGIARFTLLNANHQPINERIVFIDHHDNLQIGISPHRASYAPHDSIALLLKVTDATGKPVRGSFSLAVTDNNQVETDSAAGNMVNHLLLTDDLKGTVEQPGWYFANSKPETISALDNLLLTQGWIGYDWKQVYGPPVKPAYTAETGFAVQGKVDNLFDKPMDGAQVTLMSDKPPVFATAVTGKNGRFAFNGIIPVDTALFFLQARTKNGKDFGVGLTVDEFTAPIFTSPTEHPMPWYVNSDTATIRNRQNREALRMEDYKLTHSGTLLNTVVIADKKIVKGSENLNGPGGADQVLDETDLQQTPTKTVDDLLLQNIKDFKYFGLWQPCETCRVVKAYYMLKDKLINFIIDGVDMNFLFKQSRSVDIPWATDRMEFLKKYLSYLTAEEIKGIEVMSSFQYTAKYGLKYLNPTAEQFRYAFIEITTRDGKGPFMKKVPGTYLYRPLPYASSKNFYRPRYTAASKPQGIDLRATIHWEPQVLTDSTGTAAVSFYSADKPGNYTVIVQGADMNGSIGYQRGTIVVK